MSKVYVAGFGIVSALGIGAENNLNHLKKGVSGISKPKFFQSKYAENYHFGEVPFSDDDLLSRLTYGSPENCSRTNIIAQLAFEEAIQSAKLSASELSSFRTGIISSSTVGGMCNTDDLYADANEMQNPSVYIHTYDNANHALELAKKFQIKGFIDVVNTACSSSANAIILGSQLLLSGQLDCVIVGGVDSLAKYTVNGFNSLRILDPEWCRPFDESREGLNLGEGAGYLVLKKSSNLEKHTLFLNGYANQNDAFHPSATSEEAFGPILAMQKALVKAELVPNQIDYINAHGTGTPNNDRTELFAFSKVFDDIPPYSSTKSYTGHTLAAAGAIEAIYSLFALRHNETWKGLNNPTPIEHFKPQEKDNLQKEIHHVMSNSFGFGGNCSSLIFSKVV